MSENTISNIKIDGTTYALNDSSKASLEEVTKLIEITTENKTSIELANSKIDQLLSKVESSGLDTSDATALASQILSGYTAYVNGVKIEGTLDLSQLLPENIVSGVIINGVEGIHTCTADSPELSHYLSFSSGAPGKTGYGIYYLSSSSESQKIYTRLDEQYTLTFNLPISETNLPILQDINNNKINYLENTALEESCYFYEDSCLDLNSFDGTYISLISEHGPDRINFLFLTSTSNTNNPWEGLPAIFTISNSSYDEVNDLFAFCGFSDDNGYSYYFMNKNCSVNICIQTDDWDDDTDRGCTKVYISNKTNNLYEFIPTSTRLNEEMEGEPDPTLENLNDESNTYIIGNDNLLFKGI